MMKLLILSKQDKYVKKEENDMDTSIINKRIKANNLDITEIKKIAKECRNPSTLANLANDFANNEAVCSILAGNKACSKETLEKLAANRSTLVRYLIAQRGEELSSDFIQVRLARDANDSVKEQLARTTKKEEIKRMLFEREADKNATIKAICLKRMKNMKVIEHFILTASPDELFEFMDYLLENSNLTTRELSFILTLSIKLTDKHLRMITNHNNYSSLLDDKMKRFGHRIKS